MSKAKKILGGVIAAALCVVIVVVCAVALGPVKQKKARNRADARLVQSMNTALPAGVDAGVTTSAENLRKYLKGKGISEIITENKDVAIVYDKATRQFERMNVKKTFKTGQTEIVKAEAFAEAPYSPEEIFNGRIIVSVSGNSLAEVIYSLHNIPSLDSNGFNSYISDIMAKLGDFDGVKRQVAQIIKTTAFVDAGGAVHRATLNGENKVISAPPMKADRVVFNESLTTFDIGRLTDDAVNFKGIAIIPNTLESISFDGNIDDIKGKIGLAGNDEALAVFALENPGVEELIFGGSVEDVKANVNDALLLINDDFYVKENPDADKFEYATLKAALDAAGFSALKSQEPKNVILTGDYELSESLTVPENVILKLPYDGTKTYGSDGERNPTSELSFGDLSKQKLLFTVKENITVINRGKIEVGGFVTGSGTGHLAGQTRGDYARINLESGAKIESYGDIDVYGFITESSANNGSEVIMHSGTMKMPFIVVEHRGGSAFLALGLKIISGGTTASPFNRFFMHNVSAKLTFEASADLYGSAKLSTNSSQGFQGGEHSTEIHLIGDVGDALIQLKENSYVAAKLRADNFDVDNKQKPIKLDIYGDMTLNSMSLKLYGMFGISTDNVFFPLSWYWDVTLKTLPGQDSAAVDMSAQDLKVLPGGKFTIDEGVTVNARRIAVYAEDSWEDKTSIKYDSGKGDGTLTVNGKLFAKELGGRVKGSADSVNAESTQVSPQELIDNNGNVEDITLVLELSADAAAVRGSARR